MSEKKTYVQIVETVGHDSTFIESKEVSPEVLDIISAVLGGDYITQTFTAAGFTQHIIKFKLTEPCSECGGRPNDKVKFYHCSTCHGTGFKRLGNSATDCPDCEEE